jgi:hypothetical protein
LRVRWRAGDYRDLHLQVRHHDRHPMECSGMSTRNSPSRKLVSPGIPPKPRDQLNTYQKQLLADIERVMRDAPEPAKTTNPPGDGRDDGSPKT